MKCLFDTTSENLKPQHNETILALQYCKLVWHCNETAEECDGFPKSKATECKYKEKDNRLKQHFINGINDQAVKIRITKA